MDNANDAWRREPLIQPGLGLLLAAAILLVHSACGGIGDRRAVSGMGGNGGNSTEVADGSPATGGGAGSSSSECDGSWAGVIPCGATGEVGGLDGGTGFRLVGAPLLFNPTANGFMLNAVVVDGDPSMLRARVRAQGVATWGELTGPEVPAADVAKWNFVGLGPGTRYDYEILAPEVRGDTPHYLGSVVTQRVAGDSFTFALISDSHIGPDATFTNQGDWNTLATVGTQVGAASPDFMMNLGDMLDFHLFGFNEPPPDGYYTRLAYLNYRTLLGDTLGKTSHYAVIGNWEGEDGFYTADEIALSRQERLLYVPGPTPTTYPESGSPAEDYYAFTWGDALFVVLNVMSYTTTEHLLSSDPGLPDDWTLGAAQLAWFGDTLARATSRWRFVFIHHAVGGAAGDDANSAYGRGGGQAAYVGEQAKVHQLMLEHGVQIFFYGHDHVFTDMVVDGIHYSEPGNAGAIWMFDESITGYTQAWLEHGWSRISVSPTAVNVQFLSMDEELLYQYTLE
jgi:hypothetical protein